MAKGEAETRSKAEPVDRDQTPSEPEVNWKALGRSITARYEKVLEELAD
jgi:hypothetical protein